MRRHKKVREYSVGEEIGNSITHGVGAALAVAAIPISIVRAVGDGAGVLLAAALIYSISMLMEYLASTLYHALAVDGAKRVFKVIDHAAIYLFIAGSYTPYCLVTLSESGGMYLCAFVWALAIIGMAAEAFWTFRPRWVSVVIYLIMGWCVVGFLPALVENLAPTGLWLLLQHWLRVLCAEENSLHAYGVPSVGARWQRPAVFLDIVVRAVSTPAWLR